MVPRMELQGSQLQCEEDPGNHQDLALQLSAMKRRYLGTLRGLSVLKPKSPFHTSDVPDVHSTTIGSKLARNVTIAGSTSPSFITSRFKLTVLTVLTVVK